MSKKKLTKKQRIAAMEELKNQNVRTADREERVEGTETMMYQVPQRVEIVGLPHIRQRLELSKLIDKLKGIIDGKIESKLKYSDVLRAIELAAKLEGHIQTVKEEKHLHLHGNELKQLSEEELRKQLADIERLRESTATASDQNNTYKSEENG